MYNNNVVLIDFTGVFISCTLRTLKVASVHKRGTLWHAHFCWPHIANQSLECKKVGSPGSQVQLDLGSQTLDV